MSDDPVDTVASAQTPLPQFDVRLTPPNLAPWINGNTGVSGFTSLVADAPGPHVAVMALTHGNELAGAIVLDRLLRAGVRPARGRLTFGFANLAAFARFDPSQPTASRFLDEDMNRLWDAAILDGPRRSSELNRAREMRALIDTVDVLLDLHSMLWPSEPLILSGATPKGRALALAIGAPALVVADSGHVSGPRLIDYGRFSQPSAPHVANLVEAGQHWEPATVDMALQSVAGLLRHLGIVSEHPSLPPPTPAPQRIAEVTVTVTAATGAASQHADRHGRRGGNPHAARQLPNGYAQPAPQPWPHRRASRAFRYALSREAVGCNANGIAPFWCRCTNGGIRKRGAFHPTASEKNTAPPARSRPKPAAVPPTRSVAAPSGSACGTRNPRAARAGSAPRRGSAARRAAAPDQQSAAPRSARGCRDARAP
jgi:predicted deacylase